MAEIFAFVWHKRKEGHNYVGDWRITHVNGEDVTVDDPPFTMNELYRVQSALMSSRTGFYPVWRRYQTESKHMPSTHSLNVEYDATFEDGSVWHVAARISTKGTDRGCPLYWIRFCVYRDMSREDAEEWYMREMSPLKAYQR